MIHVIFGFVILVACGALIFTLYCMMPKKPKTLQEKSLEEAHKIITELRDKLEKQRLEYENQMQEGFEEAWQLLQEMREKEVYNRPEEHYHKGKRRSIDEEWEV